jgi:hypothetical protein
MFSTSGVVGQPFGVSIFGNVTYSADLSVYRNEIYQAMTLPGDVNHDGIVNGLDLSALASNWLKAGSGANNLSGDVNHDGVVNGLDINLISTHWLQTGPSGMPVPEPSSLILAALGAFALFTYYRHKASAG